MRSEIVKTILSVICIYLLQVAIVETRIFIPHLDVVDGTLRYQYVYGVSNWDGFIPFWGLVALYGDGTRVRVYGTNPDGPIILQEVISLDLFQDYPLYALHRKISRKELTEP